MMDNDTVKIQQSYYATTAQQYDGLRQSETEEHNFALNFLLGMLDHLQVQSVLDVGAGTGKALLFIHERRPNIRVIGIEPVQELREEGYRKGLSPHDLIDGDALAIQFPDGEFDLVCEFDVLHHIKSPELAVSEMLRVARQGIFISDCNNFGQGTWLKRTIKQLIHSVGLWRTADTVRTRGRGYTITAGDGLAYSYSVFNNYDFIRRHCRSIHLVNTRDAEPNLYRSAGHVAVLGIKK